jgi:hypothetical protein
MNLAKYLFSLSASPHHDLRQEFQEYRPQEIHRNCRSQTRMFSKLQDKGVLKVFKLALFFNPSN